MFRSLFVQIITLMLNLWMEKASLPAVLWLYRVLSAFMCLTMAISQPEMLQLFTWLSGTWLLRFHCQRTLRSHIALSPVIQIRNNYTKRTRTWEHQRMESCNDRSGAEVEIKADETKSTPLELFVTVSKSNLAKTYKTLKEWN